MASPVSKLTIVAPFLAGAVLLANCEVVPMPYLLIVPVEMPDETTEPLILTDVGVDVGFMEIVLNGREPLKSGDIIEHLNQAIVSNYTYPGTPLCVILLVVLAPITKVAMMDIERVRTAVNFMISNMYVVKKRRDCF